MKDNTQPHHDCGRTAGPKECALSLLGLDAIEKTVLTVARHVFQSFAMPGSQGWFFGLEQAQRALGRDGPLFFALVVDALREMRCARRSCFQFNSPLCPRCARLVTEHERRLMMAFVFLRRGQTGPARTELMMLCEGAETGDVEQALLVLARTSPSPTDLAPRTPVPS